MLMQSRAALLGLLDGCVFLRLVSLTYCHEAALTHIHLISSGCEASTIS